MLHGLVYLNTGPQLAVLFRKIMEPVGGGSLFKTIPHSGWPQGSIRLIILFPVSHLCADKNVIILQAAMSHLPHLSL